jgi:hypothetical protein
MCSAPIKDLIVNGLLCRSSIGRRMKLPFSLQFVEDLVPGEVGEMAFAGLFLVPTRTKPSAGGPVLYQLSLVSSAYLATASL